LGVLGSRGLVGYDLSTSSYFHREMPFDISAVDGMHPRLRNAQRLVENGGVQVLRHTGEDAEVNVAGTEVQHRVILGANHARCTCPWHAKYQGQRGLCKHILAAKLAIGKAVLE
jgi:hypothetical protein